MIKLSITYEVVKDTQVFVADKDLAMHKHVMKNHRKLRSDALVCKSTVSLVFTGVDSTQKWSLVELDNLQLWVFTTGHSAWPYIIIEKYHLCKELSQENNDIIYSMNPNVWKPLRVPVDPPRPTKRRVTKL